MSSLTASQMFSDLVYYALSQIEMNLTLKMSSISPFSLFVHVFFVHVTWLANNLSFVHIALVQRAKSSDKHSHSTAH